MVFASLKCMNVLLEETIDTARETSSAKVNRVDHRDAVQKRADALAEEDLNH